MNGIQNVGFARPVFTYNTINRRIKCEIYLGMVLKIEKTQVIEKHGYNKIQR